jgi:hypothetical protein
MWSTVLALAAAASAVGQPDLPSAREAMAAIRPEAIESHIAFLADDLLEGRGTGTRGYLIAARYVASQLRALGLEPKGEGGTFFQTVRFRRSIAVTERSSLAFWRGGVPEKLEAEKDYFVAGFLTREESRVRAPAVYVGYGVTTSDQDDYSGVDATGKIVVMLRGAPGRFPSSQRAYFSDGDFKAENAVKHGAVGMIIVWTPESEAMVPWAALGRFLRRGVIDWLEPDSRPHHARPEIRGSALVGRDGLAKLLQGSGRTADEVFARASQNLPSSFAIPGEIEIQLASRHESLESPNIIARLPGSSLADEHVVVSAHVDHEGLGEPRNGDAIYNGALDNASGTAAMLEVARAFASLSVRPRRSILFIGTAAEEEGLLGADYFANAPTVPLPSIVADVNLDGTASWYPPVEMIAYGTAHSTLSEDARAAAAMLDLRVIEDPYPEQVFFIRSDQYAFIKKGVPSLFFIVGAKSADPSIDGAAMFERYLTTLYHTPQDDLSQGFDFAAGATLARLHFLAAYRIAQGDRRPSWNPGDFFGERFGRR